jgi:hypothetical protein
MNLRSWWLGYGPWEMEASISSPSKYAGLIQIVSIEHLPASVLQELPPEGKRLSQSIRRVCIEVLLCLHAGDPEYATIDPWQARDEFLSLKRSTVDLLTFLNKYGAWTRGQQPRFSSSAQWEPQIVLPASLWAAQESIKEALKRGPSNWFADGRSSLSLLARPQFPHYEHSEVFCLDAMFAATTVDFLRGVRFRICARKDCGKPFPAERKGKRYCEQYCAHLVSVRKHRRSAKKARH